MKALNYLVATAALLSQTAVALAPAANNALAIHGLLLVNTPPLTHSSH
jgi:hypothetical protein